MVDRGIPIMLVWCYVRSFNLVIEILMVDRDTLPSL